MKLIIIIISLWLERNIGKWQELRRFPWLSAYFRFMTQGLGRFGFWQGPAGVILMLLPPVILLALFYWFLWWLFFPLAYLFALALVVLMFGPGQLEAQLKDFIASRKSGNDQSALYYAQAITAKPDLAGGEKLLPEVIQGVLIQAHVRYFTVIFWFAVLGPAGALLARLIHTVELWSAPVRAEGESFESGFYLAAIRLREWMEWPVARVVALCFGLSGSFVDFMQTARAVFMSGSRELLIQCGFAALQLPSHRDADGALVLDHPPADAEQEAALLKGVRNMVRRALMFGLAVLAILTLYGLLL